MSDKGKTDRELLEAILEGQRKLEAKADGLKSEMNNRFDVVEEQLKRLRQSQDILVREIHENKVEIDMLKKASNL